MNSFNFKNALKSFKEAKEKDPKTEEIVKYKDIIDEKLRSNKKEESILKKFDEIENERKEWFKKRNENLNKDLDNKMQSKDFNINEPTVEDKDEHISGDELSESNLPKDFDLTINKKEYKVTVDPKR
jgi:hypothetical protein